MTQGYECIRDSRSNRANIYPEELAIKDLEVGMRLYLESRLNEDGFLVASSGADIDRHRFGYRNYNSCCWSPFPKNSSHEAC